MDNWINLIVNNGVAVVVTGYFLFMNYRFNEVLTKTLTEISMTLKDIQDEMKKGESEHENKPKRS